MNISQDEGVCRYDPELVRVYDAYARAACPGYEDLHDVAACLLATALPRAAAVLSVGVGTGYELAACGRHGPGWAFTAVDPAPDMLAAARRRAAAGGADGRTTFVQGAIDAVEERPAFDAALVMIVLHFLDAAGQAALLRGVAGRLRPGAPLVVAMPVGPYDDDPRLLRAWRHRWLTQALPDGRAGERFEAMLANTHPPARADVPRLLAAAGFERPARFFSSLMFEGWVAERAGYDRTTT